MIQIDMQMPKNCGGCPCFHFENPMYCQAVKADKNKKIVAPYGATRPEWCPLKAQEAVEPLFNGRMKHFVCPNCSLVLDELQDDYCPSCGKRIAWGEYYIHEDETEGR